jgi:hypothetical protein
MMSYISPCDALGLVALYAAEGSPKYEGAAIRWLRWLALEAKDISLDDLQLAAASLGALRTRPESALQALRDVSR